MIGAMANRQNIDLMGGFRRAMPFTCATLLIGAAALAAFPATSGFFSKDEILAFAEHRGGFYWIFAIGGYIGALLTAFYAFRIGFRVAFGDPVPEARELEQGHIPHAEPENPATGEHEDTDVGFPGPEHQIAEREWPMKIAMSVLAFGALFAGLVQVPGVDAVVEHFLEGSFEDSTLYDDLPSDAAEWRGLGIGARDLAPRDRPRRLDLPAPPGDDRPAAAAPAAPAHLPRAQVVLRRADRSARRPAGARHSAAGRTRSSSATSSTASSAARSGPRRAPASRSAAPSPATCAPTPSCSCSASPGSASTSWWRARDPGAALAAARRRAARLSRSPALRPLGRGARRVPRARPGDPARDGLRHRLRRDPARRRRELDPGPRRPLPARRRRDQRLPRPADRGRLVRGDGLVGDPHPGPPEDLVLPASAWPRRRRSAPSSPRTCCCSSSSST